MARPPAWWVVAAVADEEAGGDRADVRLVALAVRSACPRRRSRPSTAPGPRARRLPSCGNVARTPPGAAGRTTRGRSNRNVRRFDRARQSVLAMYPLGSAHRRSEGHMRRSGLLRGFRRLAGDAARELHREHAPKRRVAAAPPTPPTGHARRSPPPSFLSAAPGELRRLGEPAQPAHGDDAERRSEREGRERPRPPGPTDERGNQPDRRHREREPHARLRRESGADVRGRRELGDRGGELGGIGDDRDPPDARERERDERGSAERESRHRGAGGGDRHRDHRERRPSPAVGRHATQPAAERADGDHQERGAARVEPRIAPAASHPEALREEDADPRPHRVELPHVPEIAEAREPRAALPEDREGHPEVEARRGKSVGPLAHEGSNENGPGGGEERGGAERSPPRQVGEASDQVGHRGATVRAPMRIPIARPRPSRNHVAMIFIAGGYAPAMLTPVTKRSSSAGPRLDAQSASAPFAAAPRTTDQVMSVRGDQTSGRLPSALASVPMMKPAWTAIVSAALPPSPRAHSRRSAGKTAEALNQRPSAPSSASERTVSCRQARVTRVRYSMTPFSRSRPMSAAESPRSFRTFSVCPEGRGAALRIAPGVSESLMATPTWRTRPCFGCSTSTIIRRWLSCGSRTISSTSYTLPTHTSAFVRRANHSSRSRVRMIASISRRAASSSALAARTNWSGLRANRASSGRPIALQKFSQSHGSVPPIVRSLPSRVS